MVVRRATYMNADFTWKHQRSRVSTLAAGLLLLGTGCQTVEKYSLTYRVWDNDDWR